MRGIRSDAVFHQLDDLNAMGDALASAVCDNDVEHIASLRASLGRFTVAMGWRAEAVLPVILAYVDKHAAFAEDLFAPAFILRAIAPQAQETAALLARLPESVRDLLALLGEQASISKSKTLAKNAGSQEDGPTTPDQPSRGYSP
jgi:hypothetical protein